MTRKNVCFIITDAVSFNALCKGQLEYLRDSGQFKLTLLCGGSDAEFSALVARDVGRVKHVGLVRAPHLFRDILALLRLWWFLLWNRFDLVVYSTPKAMLLGSLAAAFSLQSRRVALVRGRVYENYVGWPRSVYSFLDRLTLLLSHKALFISRSLRDAYIAEGISSVPKSIVLGAGSSNGVNVDRFMLARRDGVGDACRAQYGVSPNDLLVLVVGRICRDKGISDFSDIVRHVSSPAVKFMTVGCVEDDASGIALKKAMEIKHNVIHVPVSDDVSKMFAMADLHLFLSYREGFGNVAIEAAAASVPTLAYDVVGVKDSVEPDVSGIRFKFGDVVAIAEFIDWAADHKEALRARFSGAHVWAKAHFDQPVVWKRYMDFYIDECGRA